MGQSVLHGTLDGHPSIAPAAPIVRSSTQLCSKPLSRAPQPPTRMAATAVSTRAAAAAKVTSRRLCIRAAASRSSGSRTAPPHLPPPLPLLVQRPSVAPHSMGAGCQRGAGHVSLTAAAANERAAGAASSSDQHPVLLLDIMDTVRRLAVGGGRLPSQVAAQSQTSKQGASVTAADSAEHLDHSCCLRCHPGAGGVRPLLPRHAPLLWLHLQRAAGGQAPHRLGAGGMCGDGEGLARVADCRAAACQTMGPQVTAWHPRCPVHSS